MSININNWETIGDFTFESNALITIKNTTNTSVLAGPGAGKTEILAQKACFLLQTGIVPWPIKILSITRKREAATNIKSRVELRCGKVLSERFHSYTIEAFTKSIIDRFMSILPEQSRPNNDYTIAFSSSDANFPESLTFNELTTKAQEILESSPILLNIIRATYSHVFIDEFQDLNEIQYDFIKRIFQSDNNTLTTVGDTKQAIMKFANALPDIFERFREDFNAEILPLYINHRSSTELKSFLGNLAYKWWPESSEVEDIHALDNNKYLLCCHDNENEEATYLSQLINRWIQDEGIKPNEIGVLFRSNTNDNYSKHLTSKLNQLDILSINESTLQDHLSEPIGQILISFLKLVTSRRNSYAWEKLTKLFIYANGYTKEDKCQILLSELILFIDSKRTIVNDTNEIDDVLDIIESFLNQYFDNCLEKAWPQYSQGNLLESTVLSIIDELEKSKTSNNTWEDAVDLITGTEAVRMMTIHKSKGLEFEAVILLGFENYCFFRFGQTQKKLDEERSTIFVALSRAKERLFISASKHREHSGVSSFSEMRSIINDIEENGILKRTF